VHPAKLAERHPTQPDQATIRDQQAVRQVNDALTLCACAQDDRQQFGLGERARTEGLELFAGPAVRRQFFDRQGHPPVGMSVRVCSTRHGDISWDEDYDRCMMTRTVK
jgi:hypothetical protein